MGQHKLKSVVNWQRTRRERGVQEKGVNQGQHVINLEGLQSNRSSNLQYEGRLISNAHSEISRKRGHVFKQTKVGSK